VVFHWGWEGIWILLPGQFPVLIEVSVVMLDLYLYTYTSYRREAGKSNVNGLENHEQMLGFKFNAAHEVSRLMGEA